MRILTPVGIKGVIMAETEVKLTKLAKCAGCGAKVGAGTLSQLLEGFPTHFDPNLIVGYDKSDDAGVYVINEDTALVMTTDFFPPIVDDPFLYGQIAATNALSDIYAMGAVPKLALNIFCAQEKMSAEVIREILRGGYDKTYEAGAIIAGGHTIQGAEPLYGLAVNGFVHPKKVLKNCGARPGDVLLLTKPLGVGILTTAAKAELVEKPLLQRVYEQMRTLNKTACEIMVRHEVHSCTDVTGFGLLGHGFEMAQGSDVTIHFQMDQIPIHQEAIEMAKMGMIPAGAYRNRAFAAEGVSKKMEVSLAMEDVLYDPQTSGGLLMAVPEWEAGQLLLELCDAIPVAKQIGYVTGKEENSILLE